MWLDMIQVKRSGSRWIYGLIAVAVFLGMPARGDEILQKFPYSLNLRLEKNAMSGVDTKIRIIEIRGTRRKLEVGGSYIVRGEVRSRDPRMVTVYAGVTNSKNDGALDLEGFSRYYYPGEKKEMFLVGFLYNSEGEFHVSAYPQTPNGTDWTTELFDLRLKAED